jgi:hypothetical protein
MKRAAGVFALMTVAMTWPLARTLATAAPDHQDVYFNMWRLRWFAHALATHPLHLFDANIFHPATGTLALSDAMPIEGLAAAPLLWAGVPPVLVHNILILLPIAASGAAMFALVRHLTGSHGAGFVAGVAFAYAPYRFEHLMHMELQWIVWTPLAFLAVHRVLETRRWTLGAAAGACVALQMLSCIYYGIFLALVLVPSAALLIAADRPRGWRRSLVPLAAGAAIAVAISAAYAVPYMRQHEQVGDRAIEDVNTFSASPANYLSVPAGNWMYGSAGRPGRGERRLFPGAIVVLLAIVGLLLRPPDGRAIVYLLVLVAAFETSRGFGGHVYPLLHDYVPVFRGLRAMARFGIFVVMALAVLAGYGYAALMHGRGAMVRRAGLAVLVASMLAEYATRITLVSFPNAPPEAYRELARLPKGVVADLPLPAADQLPGFEPRRAYMSTFHWFPIVNGYSGNYPPSYLARLDRLHGFPDERSLMQVRRDGVRYVVVHEERYSAAEVAAIRTALSGAGMAELGRFDDGEGSALIYLVR